MTPQIQPFSSALIEELASKIQENSLHTPVPFITSVSGGSSTGKTTQVALNLQKNLGASATILSQDNFQKGKPFVSELQSPYKWDDPRNFAFDEEIVALKQLKEKQEITIPTFSIPQVKRVGTQSFVRSPIIIFEGLYTNYQELTAYSQFRIYVESPLFVRFLRRILRFTKHHGIPDKEKAVKQFLTTVTLAHNKFVVEQRSTADVIVQTDFDYDEANELFQLENDFEQITYDKMLYRFNYKNNLSLSVVKQNGKYLLVVSYQDQSFFNTSLSEELFENIKNLDFSMY